MTICWEDPENYMYSLPIFTPHHFNREVLLWKVERPDIHYIFSKDILKHRRATREDAHLYK